MGNVQCNCSTHWYGLGLYQICQSCVGSEEAFWTWRCVLSTYLDFLLDHGLKMRGSWRSLMSWYLISCHIIPYQWSVCIFAGFPRILNLVPPWDQQQQSLDSNKDGLIHVDSMYPHMSWCCKQATLIQLNRMNDSQWLTAQGSGTWRSCQATEVCVVEVLHPCPWLVTAVICKAEIIWPSCIAMNHFLPAPPRNFKSSKSAAVATLKNPHVICILPSHYKSILYALILAYTCNPVVKATPLQSPGAHHDE